MLAFFIKLNESSTKLRRSGLLENGSVPPRKSTVRPSTAVPIAIAAVLFSLSLPALSADVSPRRQADATAMTRYIENEATILALRTKFSVLLPEQAEQELEQVAGQG